ncbi:MAG: nuclear transport factor 2 family protein [Pseudobdellovibrionaceae bacterium]
MSEVFRKTWLLAGLCGLLFTVVAMSANADSGSKGALKKAYAEFKVGMSTSNLEKLGTVFAKDYTITSWQGGQITGEQLLQMMRTGQIQIVSASILEENFRFYHKTMLVTGRMQNEIVFQGSKLDEDMRFTSLYVMDGSKAVLVHTQTTMIAKPQSNTEAAKK